MNRKIYAELSVDEGQAIRNAEVNGISNDGTLDYLEKEFGWLEQSGIALKEAVISDEDDTEDWGRYIDYVIAWGFANYSADGEKPKIMTYEQWREENGLPEETPCKKKIALIYPESGAVSLIHNLGAGEPTANGDRTSEYINIATVMGRTKFVKAALIEETTNLPPEEQGYALHIINDVDGTDCRLMRTIGLDTDELAKLLKEILDAMQEGRM